nr:mammalian uncoordinated homology 13, domain 2 [Tanacetum cinerariifolium]
MGKYLIETDEYVSGSRRKSTVDQSSYTIGYRKMKSLVINVINEFVSDIEMHDKQVLHTFVDLPCLSTCLYSSQLSNRMRAFLTACPPASLSPPVTDLIITTCDFQKDLLDWNISPVYDAFDAKALFNMYITKRINDKRLELLESCKLYKQGIDVNSCIHKNLGNGEETVFWDEIWCDNEAFKYRYPRLYALETCKSIDVAAKFAHTSIDHSFRRCPRSGAEQTQLSDLRSKLVVVSLVDARDKWK